jgi:hypothetical protein
VHLTPSIDALPELGFSGRSGCCDTHAGDHIGFSMPQAGEFEGYILRIDLGKRILRLLRLVDRG